MKRKSKLLTGLLAALPIGYLFTVAPNRRSSELKERLKNADYAHRGLYDNLWHIPENSMKAFRLAVEHGYGMEMDIHLTKDNRLVVFHDDTLKRMCHIDKHICDMTWDELKDVRLLDTDEGIPLFEDVLSLVDGKVPLIIELKVDHGNYNELCYEADQMLSQYKGDYCIESFHPMAVAWYRRHRKDVIRGQLSCNYKKTPSDWQPGLIVLSYLVTNFITRPDFIAYDYQDINNLGFFLNHRLFKAMTVLWTVTDKKSMDILKKFGHTIIFEKFEP